MKTKTKTGKAPAKRTRRPSINRAPRSTYGVSADGKMLYRFSTIAAFRQAQMNDIAGLKPCTAAEFLASKNAGTKVTDLRGMPTEQVVKPEQVVHQAIPTVIERGVSYEKFRVAVHAALQAMESYQDKDGAPAIIHLPVSGVAAH